MFRIGGLAFIYYSETAFLIDRISNKKSYEFARRNAITASELCQIRNEAALSLTGYVSLSAWHFLFIVAAQPHAPPLPPKFLPNRIGVEFGWHARGIREASKDGARDLC